LRRLARPGDGENASGAALAWCNVAVLPLAFALMPLVGQQPIVGTARDWAVIAVLGVFQVGLAYVVLASAVRHVPAVRASLLLMIEPSLNPVITFAVHGEEPPLLAIAGGALIIGSVAAAAV